MHPPKLFRFVSPPSHPPKKEIFTAMGLLPIEYIDCFVDSPNFRDIIAIYEKELESNSQVVMNLVKECRNMINATEGELFFKLVASRLGLNMIIQLQNLENYIFFPFLHRSI